MQKLFGAIEVRGSASPKIVRMAVISSILCLAIAAVPLHAQVTFTALLNSGQENPPTGSNSFGVAFVTLEPTLMLCYSISYSALVAAETQAHFHSPAKPGENAGVLFPISPSPSQFGSPKVGCVGPLNIPEIIDLLTGKFYINIHSATNPGGEIRGQVLLQANIQ